jgi:hypothetical protein
MRSSAERMRIPAADGVAGPGASSCRGGDFTFPKIVGEGAGSIVTSVRRTFCALRHETSPPSSASSKSAGRFLPDILPAGVLPNGASGSGDAPYRDCPRGTSPVRRAVPGVPRPRARGVLPAGLRRAAEPGASGVFPAGRRLRAERHATSPSSPSHCEAGRSGPLGCIGTGREGAGDALAMGGLPGRERTAPAASPYWMGGWGAAFCRFRAAGVRMEIGRVAQ